MARSWRISASRYGGKGQVSVTVSPLLGWRKVMARAWRHLGILAQFRLFAAIDQVAHNGVADVGHVDAESGGCGPVSSRHFSRV